MGLCFSCEDDHHCYHDHNYHYCYGGGSNYGGYEVNKKYTYYPNIDQWIDNTSKTYYYDRPPPYNPYSN